MRLLLATSIVLGLSLPALGQATLTELNAANAARNEMIGNAANPNAANPNPAGVVPPAPGEAPPATAASSGGGMQRNAAYALIVLLTALGMFVICRPSPRRAV